MGNVAKVVFFIILFGWSNHHVFSQAPGSTTLNRLRINEVYAGQDSEGSASGENEYVWIVSFLGTENCIRKDGDPGWYSTATYLATNLPVSNITNTTYTITTEAWENDCDGRCSYGDCTTNHDDAHCGPVNSYLRLSDYQPGMVNTVELSPCTAAGRRYALRCDFSYDVPKPEKPKVVAPTGNICLEEPSIQLSTRSFINTLYLSRVRYLWQYRVGLTGSWLPLARTSYGEEGNSFSVTRIRDLVNVTTNTDVFFRVRLMYDATNGNTYWSDDFSEPSNAIHLSPRAPVINSVTSTSSCPNRSTGTVKVNVTGMGAYKYIIRERGASCDPSSNGCAIEASGDGTGNEFIIRNIAPGLYTLIITNPGDQYGVCGDAEDITVEGIAPLQVAQPGITPVSCQGGNDGAVTLTPSGGITPWVYFLTGSGVVRGSTTGTFNTLRTGQYTAVVSDVCSQVVNVPVQITEPQKVQASVTVTNPFCNVPADGSVTVSITQGEGRYSYKLMKDGLIIQTLDDVTLTSWQISNLSAGTYAVEVKDALRLSCEGFTTSVEIMAAPAFHIVPADIVQQNLTCFEANNGIIQLQGVNENGEFEYVLSDQQGTQVSSATVPRFTPLGAGTYFLSMKRNRTGCQDQFDHPQPITLTQPDEMITTLNKQDISCYGQNDGKIISSVAGATPTDRYQWERLINGNWATLNDTDLLLENLSSGAYRFSVSNGNGCTAPSAEIAIIEPEALSIAEAIVKDIVCFGEPGEIEAIAQGGTAPFQYHYTAANGNTILSSSQNTLLNEGRYTLQLSDVNGCAVHYADPLSITSPKSPLSFTYTLSDFSGYNVSCVGSDDGYVQLVATGGEDSAPYQYALNEMARQESSRIEHIAAGIHEISVIDRRGCLVSHTINMTAPAAELMPVLVEKQDVKCYGDENGLLSVEVSGGVAPYTYRLFETIAQQNGVFTGLPPGEYTITMADKNGCAIQYSNTIDIQSPPMSVLMQQTNVSCYSGADGTIVAEVAGGTSPLQYQWLNDLGTTLSLHNLRAGDYTLQITDQQGCKQQQTTTITEPIKLGVTALVTPVCADKTTGELRLKPRGGTAPYQYSIDAGATYQTSALFTTIAAGPHPVRVKDDHQCEVDSVLAIPVRNDRPEPNFIVATKQNARDTLVVREISLPKPDSIEWSFDPGITIVKNDLWSPEITIKESGNYGISMKGFFGGCTYIHRQTLSIDPYDPERGNTLTTPVKAIREVIVTPNPTNGIFRVDVALETQQRLVLKVIDILGIVYFQEKLEGTSGISREIDLSSATLASGIYVLQAVTDTDSREVRIVISR